MLLGMNRVIKQIIYGAGYLALLALIVFVVYYIWFKPAPTCFDNIQNGNEIGIDCGGACPSCEIKSLVSLDDSWIKYFPAETQTAIVAKINNANLRWGADSFNYALDIYGSDGNKIKTISGNSFIYSGEIKYLFTLAEIDAKNISDIKISFSDVRWKQDTDFPRPAIQTRGIETAIDQSANAVIVSGFVANNNAFNLSKLRIIGILSDSKGVPLSASKTELENAPAFTETQFKINFPKNVSLATPPRQISYTFSRDLTVGSTGEDVNNLQEFLTSQGFFNAEISGKFDSTTKNALIQFQKQVKLSPASGYFGSKTRNYINSLKTPAQETSNLDQADPNKTEIYVEALR